MRGSPESVVIWLDAPLEKLLLGWLKRGVLLMLDDRRV